MSAALRAELAALQADVDVLTDEEHERTAECRRLRDWQARAVRFLDLAEPEIERRYRENEGFGHQREALLAELRSLRRAAGYAEGGAL